jgi:glycosyltransferase involved in cell wall biosynthesis
MKRDAGACPPDDGPAPRVTVVIPTYDEAARIPGSIERWKTSRMLEHFPCVFVDDGSADETVGLLEPLAGRYPSVRLLALRPHRSKPRVIRAALQGVSTPYVLCLDADTWFPGDASELDAECARLVGEGLDLAGFRLQPGSESRSVLVDLQAAEFAFMTDVARRAFGYVGNVNGAASFWRTDLLRAVLAVHSGEFEGDDLESTLIAHRMRAKVGASRLTFRKFAKTSFRALARQRIRIWELGLFRVFATQSLATLPPNNDTVFLRWYALFEAALLPAKAVGFAFLCLSLACGPVGGPPLQMVRGGMFLIYGSAVALSVGQWWRHRKRLVRGTRLLGLWAILWLYPSLYLWFGASAWSVALYLAIWSTAAMAWSTAISDRAVRSRSLLLSPILPLYFLLVALVFRTAGMALWAARSVWQRATGGRPAPRLWSRVETGRRWMPDTDPPPVDYPGQ